MWNRWHISSFRLSAPPVVSAPMPTTHAPGDQPPFLVRGAAVACFMLSGFAGLLYQTTWLRQVMGFFGASTPTVAVTLALFMAGLTIGSFAGGRWSRLLSPRGALLAYAAVETVIAAGGALAAPWMAWLRGREWWIAVDAVGPRWALTVGCLVVVLLPWTVAMGATYPFFLRFTEGRRGFSFGHLYAANVAGALAGTLVTAFVLVEYLGFRGSQYYGIAANVAAALLALALLGGARGAPKKTTPVPFAATRVPNGGRLAAATFLVGFVSLGYEVVWTRIYTPILGTEVYAFAAMLATYLAATCAGSLGYRAFPGLLQRPGRAHALLAPLVVASGVLPHVAVAIPGLSEAWRVVLGLAPFGFLTGFWTPLIVEQYANGSASRTGWVYAWNGLGCLAGPLSAGFLLLPIAGCRLGLLLLTFLLVVPGYLLGGRFRFASLLPLVAAIPVFSLVPGFEERVGSRIILHDRVATVAAVGRGWERQILVNGIGMTMLVNETKWMVHLPAMAHGHPRKILVICFGMGTSFRSALSWGAEVTAVDLVPSVPRLFGYYHRDAAEVMANPRGRVVVDDGRHFLDTTREKYDVIVVDPPPPLEAAHSAVLNSQEFFAAARRALAPGGILMLWSPNGTSLTQLSQISAMEREFPHLAVYRSLGVAYGLFMLASERPLPDPELPRDLLRAPEAARKDMAEWVDGDLNRVAALLRPIVHRRSPSAELAAWRPAMVPLQDDFPVNEYFWIRAGRSPAALRIEEFLGLPPVAAQFLDLTRLRFSRLPSGASLRDADLYRARLALTLRDHPTVENCLRRLANRHPELPELEALARHAEALRLGDP